MKKLSLIIALAFVLAMALGTVAFAAQAASNYYGGFNNYQATPTYQQVYDSQGVHTGTYNSATGEWGVTKGVYNSNSITGGKNYFNADDETNYPYEIYLPNESNPAQYRIHTNYTKNTDACASCHATHTAVGASLLQWYSVYETCMACHDGTVTTTYNVENSEIGTSGMPAFGGMFGTGAEKYASKHNAQGSVSIAAAPGGSSIAETTKTVDGQSKTMWNKTFGCESCHTPHGQAGNARILHPDPNFYATKAAAKKGYLYKAGLDANNVGVSGAKAVYDGGFAETDKVTLIKGYPYTMKFYAIDNQTEIIDGVNVSNMGENSAGSYTYLYGANVAQVVYVKAVASIKVRMNIKNYLGVDDNDPNHQLAADEAVYHVAGVNNFCGACHVDYNTEDEVIANNGSEEIMKDNGSETFRPGYGLLNGEYSKAHRHAVGVKWNYGDSADTDYIGFADKPMATMGVGENGYDKDSARYQANAGGASYISCLTCHFAHGTNNEMWKSWLEKFGMYGSGEGQWAWGELEEIAGSSALKKLPNMATCEACHQKADANQGYLANTSLQDYTAEKGISNTYIANAAHEAYFKVNTYRDATTCIVCHESAAYDMLKGAHWNLSGASTTTKDYYGGLLQAKPTTGNAFTTGIGMPFGMADRFCGYPGGAAGVSWAYTYKDSDGTQRTGNSCGKCHISLGTAMPPLFTDMNEMGSLMMSGKTADEANAIIAAANIKKIDCLACHMDDEIYNPTLNRKVVSGTFQYNFDYAKVGKVDNYKIQLPDNENCMTCHEHGMGGALYKRQGLYSDKTDIHSAENMDCMDCHPVSRHQFASGSFKTDLIANDRPDVEVSCVSSKCHTSQPHEVNYSKDNGSRVHTSSQAKVDYLNKHTGKLACQVCHVNNSTNAYADAAKEEVNATRAKFGYDAIASSDVFKGGAIYYDYRMLDMENGPYFGMFGGLNGASTTNSTAKYGFLGNFSETGFQPFMLNQPGNYAWRWYNGTGSGMANAWASFGFYDPYNGAPDHTFTGNNMSAMVQGFFSFYLGNSNYAAIQQSLGQAMQSGQMAFKYNDGFAGFNKALNTLDNETQPAGQSGDKIYAFRKAQFWMPVPKLNMWFLTPHDQAVMRDTTYAQTYKNYASLQAALHSPMMYMFMSGMFKPAMDIYAGEFGFQYSYTPVAVTNSNLLASGITELNGTVYSGDGRWLDDAYPDLYPAATLNAMYGTAPFAAGTLGKMIEDMWGAGMAPALTASYAAGYANEDALRILNYATTMQALKTFCYMPMPLDANLMTDHAVAAINFNNGYGEYEPRSCSECHKAAATDGTNYVSFDKTDWDPLSPATPVAKSVEWASYYDSFTSGKSAVDWKALGYTNAQISSYTDAAKASTWGLTSWGQFDN